MKKIIRFLQNLIHHYNNSKSAVHDLVLQNSHFLEPGVYKINESKSILYNKKFKKAILQENRFVFFEKFKKTIYEEADADTSTRWASRLLSIFYKEKVNPKETPGLGQCVIFSTLKYDKKIINFREKTIFTKFRDQERMRFVLQKRKDWENLGFCTVPIIEIDESNLLLKEHFISKIEYPHQKGFRFILQDIARCFAEHPGLSFPYSVTEENLNNIKSLSRHFSSREAKESFIQCIDQFIDTGSYKKCICHGDLYYNNLMYDGHSFYYLDFELEQEHFFIFDILFYIFFESFRYHNDSLLSDYLSGKFDAELKAIFDSTGVPYQTQLRKTYLWIMCFEYYGTHIPKQFVAKLLAK